MAAISFSFKHCMSYEDVSALEIHVKTLQCGHGKGNEDRVVKMLFEVWKGYF